MSLPPKLEKQSFLTELMGRYLEIYYEIEKEQKISQQAFQFWFWARSASQRSWS